MAAWSSVSIKKVMLAERIDAEFFRPEHIERANKIRKLGGESLGDFAEISNGSTPTDYFEDGSVAFVRSGDLTSPLIDGKRADRFLRSNPQKDVFSLSRGDVLISSIGVGSIGKVSFVTDPTGLATVAEVTVVRTCKLPPEFIWAFLSTTAGLGEIERRVTGATGQQHLNKREAERILVPTHVPSELLALLIDYINKSEIKLEQAVKNLANAESCLMAALALDELDLSPSKTYARSFRDLDSEGRFDAEYFNPKYQTLIEHLRVDGLTLSDVCNLAQRKFVPKLTHKQDTFNYIEIGSLTGHGEAETEKLRLAEAPSRATWIVKPGDVITSLVRPIRRLSAMIRDEQKGDVCSSGFAVLEPTGIEPEVLLCYLRLPLICELLDLNTIATMYPAIPTERLMRIPIRLPDDKTRKEITGLVNASIAARREAADLLEQAKRRVEDLIESGG